MSGRACREQELNGLQLAIENQFNLSLFTLLPIVVMLVLSFLQVSAEPTMVMASVVAVLIAIFVQDQSVSAVLNSLYSGGSIETGHQDLDQLLGRGGIGSMMWTLSLSLLALALGGILERCQFLRVLITTVLLRVKRTASLVTMTIVSCFVGNMAMGEAYMSIILGGQLFSKAYEKKKLDKRVLSRSLEDGATLTTALIPWTTAGVFFSATLGVAVLDYAPWALLNWLNPLISIVLAFFGVALFQEVHQQQENSGRVEVQSSLNN